MAELKMKADAPKGGRWLRRLVILAAVFVVLLIAGYFILTSSAFVKGFIVPKVGAALNADIAVADAKVSPLSQVVLREVKVTPKGAEQILAVAELRARYSLWSIIRGTIAVEEVVVNSPVVTLVEGADGTSNLDPLLKALESAEPEKPATTPSPKEPTSVDVKIVSLNNATVRLVTHLKSGGRDVTELSNLNVTIRDIKNGQAGKLDLNGALTMEMAAQPDFEGGSVGAKLLGTFTFNLTPDLQPASLQGEATATIEKAAGLFTDVANLTAKLACETTPTEVKQAALRFSKAGAALGEVRASGPFALEKMEGKLKVEVLSLDRQVLNLVGAPMGMDFGTTTINSANDVELANAGERISVVGQFNVARFQVIQPNQTTPTVDLRGDYNVMVDLAGESALLRTLNVIGTQNGQPLLQTELTSPMPIAWGKATDAVGDAALNVTVTNLNLTDWKAFAGDLAPAGMAGARVKLLSQQGGKQLTFEVASQVKDFSAQFGSNRVQRADVLLSARGVATDLEQFKLDEYRLELARQNQTALTVTGSGNVNTTTEAADLQMALQASLAQLLALLPQPDFSVSAGALEFKGRVTNQGQTQTVVGQLALTDFSGSYDTFRFANFGTWVDFDVALKDDVADIRKASGVVRENREAGGRFEAGGKYDLERSAGSLTLKLVDFNQHGLRPFLESALGDKKLVSVALNTTASATLGANGDADVKADLKVTNLVVNDPSGTVPATPLEAAVQVDTSVVKNVATVRQAQLTLTPTDRAKNQLNLSGTVDYSVSNAITGDLKLTSESLDVTRYYDLFAGAPAASPAAPVVTKPAETATDPNQEPEAVNLPFRNFTFAANIGRFYLREVDIASLQTTAKLEGSRVVVKPCQLTLNGAPVNATADLDLGIPGYKYDLTFNAQTVPLTPLINTFVTDRKGQIGGTTTASVEIKGAGVTGASLQKNLAGQFNVLSTNLNLSISNVRNPLINSVINIVIGIPELIRNPMATVGNWIGNLTGSGKGGWADEITAAPIDTLLLQGTVGNGRVNLDQADIRSSAFHVAASGPITLVPVLDHSTIQIPVSLSLSRPLGDKIGLVDANTPTNAVYVPMPQFLTMKGTLDKPKPDINYLALGALAAKTGAGLVKGVGGAAGEKIGGALNLVGGILGGQRASADTNAPSATATNQPAATNQPPADPVGGLIRGIGGFLGGNRSTSKGTNQPAKP